MAVSLKVSRLGGMSSSGNPQMSLRVKEAITIPQEVFVYKIDDRGESYDTYYSVATIDDLDKLPTSRVNSAKDDFYLRSSAVIQFSSPNKAVKGKEEVEYALNDLVTAYKLSLEVLSLDDEIEVING